MRFPWTDELVCILAIAAALFRTSAKIVSWENGGTVFFMAVAQGLCPGIQDVTDMQVSNKYSGLPLEQRGRIQTTLSKLVLRADFLQTVNAQLQSMGAHKCLAGNTTLLHSDLERMLVTEDAVVSTRRVVKVC